MKKKKKSIIKSKNAIIQIERQKHTTRGIRRLEGSHAARGGVSLRQKNRTRHQIEHGSEKKSEEGDTRNKRKMAKRRDKKKRRKGKNGERQKKGKKQNEEEYQRKNARVSGWHHYL